MALRPTVAPSPAALVTGAWEDYALIDSGGGRKLERYGPYRVIRPEPQCLWTPRLGAPAWSGADATFDPADEEDAGRWRFARRLPESFPLAWGPARFEGRFTAFRHLGFFPEQAANWAWIEAALEAAGAGRRLLNLFGYTGVASLVAAAAGAEVTHVDASKKAVGWGRANAVLSRLADRPVRWVCEDARKYVQREVRRGAHYDAIVLDPPKYGRGPAGEVWRLYEHLPGLVEGCAALLSEQASFLLLNAYSERLSGLALASLLADALSGRGGWIDWGELVLMEEGGARGAGLSFFARWSAP